MNLKQIILDDLKGWGKYERIIFPLELLFIIILSLVTGDDKIALISAVCGILYTIFAGKGKISCYFFGITGTLCYAYISFKNHLYGNLGLYLLYYFPMQIFGIFKWKSNLKRNSYEIVKTHLSNCERIIYLILSVIFCFVCYLVLVQFGEEIPIFDAVTSVLSVFGLILTVKRCIEQWYLWIIVNGLSTLMWIKAYMHGSNCLATIIMWFTYFILSFYFLHSWNKEVNLNQQD